MVVPGINSSLQGLAYHQRLLSDSASKLAPSRGTPEAPSSSFDPVQGAVGLLQARSGISANLAVLRANDTMIGTLLDTLA